MENETAAILCVDDEVNILRALKRVLRRESYRLLTANSAAEAMEILSREEDVHVIISDQRMPETDGVTLLKNVKEAYPDIIRITLTGFTDVDSIKEAVNQGHIYKFLLKPWDDDNLVLEIRQAVKQYQLARANRELAQRISAQNEELRRFNEHLETLVRERTEEIVVRNKALELAQAVLFDLPVPIVGLDSDGMIAMTNHALDDMLKDVAAVHVGQMIDDVVPEKIAQLIREALSKQSETGIETCEMGGARFQIQCVPLSGNFQGHGMVLSFSRV